MECFFCIVFYVKLYLRNTETEVNEAMKDFNTTAICVPELHYMVDISAKIENCFIESR